MEANEEERAWVRRARDGDREAWDRLLSLYQLRLFGFARRLVGSREDAMDVVQETFGSAIHNISSLREDQRFAGWLFAIARQRSLQCLRRRGRSMVEAVEELPDAPDPGQSVEELVFRREESHIIDQAISSLPEPQKTAILLHYFLDLSLAEIAQAMESPVGTVKSRLHFGREVLRRVLSEKPR